MHAKSLKLCPILCDPKYCSPPGSSVHGILQVRILEWVAMPFSKSHALLFMTPWTIARQAPLSMGSSRQEYQRGLPFPTPGDLPDPGMEPASPALAGRFFTTEPPARPPKSSNLELFHLLPGSQPLSSQSFWPGPYLSLSEKTPR